VLKPMPIHERKPEFNSLGLVYTGRLLQMCERQRLPEKSGRSRIAGVLAALITT
jgi:hypothetical protein